MAAAEYGTSFPSPGSRVRGESRRRAGCAALHFVRPFSCAVGDCILQVHVPFALLFIPPVADFVVFFAVSMQLNIHLRSYSGQISRMQQGSMPDEVEEELKNPNTCREMLGPNDKWKLEMIQKRFKMETMLRRAESHKRIDALIDDASSWSTAGPTFAPGGGMARTIEFLVLAISILAIAYIFLGFREARNSGADWATALLYGGMAATCTLLVIKTIQFVLIWRGRRRLERATLPCLMCGKETRRRTNWGALRPHFCTEKCEQNLIQFLGGIRQVKSSCD